MGDVISSHLDESRRQYISERTGKLLAEFGKLYEEQYGVALFNSVRYEIEGNGGPQTQLLHRKVPNIDKVIFSGNLFQYLDDTKKWRNRFCLVPNHYGPLLYENKIAYDRGLQPRAGINCAGYRVFTSLDQYTEMLNNSVPGGKVKAGSAPMKCATQFPVILWHPYCRHYHFCFMTEREQQRWSAVFQDCVRHSNNGIPEEARVEAAAFTDSVRLYRQARDQYGTWDMLCGNQVQVLSNLVMEDLLPDLKNIIGPKLRGKPQDRQRAWLLISDTVYRMVHEKARLFYEGLEKKCGDRRAEMESQIRTDMDQIIACKEHVSNKIRAAVLPKAELCVRNHVQSHIPSILEALMVPTSQGFSEVRELVFTEATEMNKNLVNEGGRDKLGEHMEKISQLAYHPVKMQQCYEKMDHLNLEGLQQRFDVGGPSVFKQRAQILMREQTDNAVYTLEQLIHQDLNKTEGTESLCRDIQRILERVLKKYDYDSSTVRKKFFQEALLQIIIPFLLKKLAPTCKSELPRYQELIFEELSRFVLLENIYEEVVLQTVMRDIIQAVKDAATQRKHNLYRDSMVLHNSDPNLHLLGEGPPINWTDEFGDSDGKAGERHGRVRQVVSIIQDDEAPEYLESCQEAPANEDIPEEPGSSDVHAIRSMLVKEFDVEVPVKDVAETSSRVEPAEEVTHAARETPESHTEVHASAHERHGDTLDHSHAEASPEHERHAEAAREHERRAEAAPEHERCAEASPEHERHVEASPEHERHAEAAPEYERHAEASPEHERHAEAAPEYERHAEASPEHERHAAAAREHERHAEASPEHESHAEASPEHKSHAEASPEHGSHAGASPEHKSHAGASPEHKSHAGASPEHKSHAGASPEHKSHAEASPEHVSHAEASPEHAKPVYRSATDILKDVHTKQVERSQPTSDHLVVDRQRFTPEAVKECASPEPSETEEDDHRVQGINHRPTTPEVTSSSLVTPTEESQAQPLPSPVTHIVHSTPDDSGFQSPLSEEEEEGEGYKEVPVPAPRKRDEVITQF